MFLDGYAITTKDRKRGISINIKRPDEAHSYDINIHHDILPIAADIITAVLKEKEEANG